MIWIEAAGLLAAGPGAAAYDLILLFIFSLLFAAASLLPVQTDGQLPARRWRLAAAAGAAVQLPMLALSAALASGLSLPPQVLASAGYGQLWLLTLALAWPALARRGPAVLDRILALLAVGGGIASWAAPTLMTAWDQSLGAAWLAPAFALGLDVGLLCLAGLRRSPDWRLVAACLGLAGAGNGAALLIGASAFGLPGWPRLTSLAAFPVLSLVGIRAMARSGQTLQTRREGSSEPSNGVALPPESVAALLGLLDISDPLRLMQQSVEALARGLRSAYVMVVTHDGPTDSLVFAPGFDLLRERAMRAARQPAKLLPQLAQAVIGHHRLAWDTSERSESTVLARALSIAQAAPALLLPLHQDPRLPASALLILTPYGDRQAALRRSQALEAATSLLGKRLGQLSHQAGAPGGAKPDQDADLKAAELQISQLQAEQVQLLELIGQFPVSGPPGRQALGEQIADLQASLQAAQDQIRQLNAEIGRQADRLQAAQAAPEPAQAWPATAARLIQSLRPPLTSLLGYCTLLLGKSGEGLDPTQRKYLGKIHEDADRISALLGSLLGPNAPSAGLALIEQATCPVGDCLRQAIRRCAPLFMQKDLRLQVEPLPDLPPVGADASAVTQMLEQLLGWAAAAAPPGGQVTAGVEQPDGGRPDYVVLTVTRPGLPGPQDDPALAVLRALVESAGGRLWIEPLAGEGIRSSLLLPLSQLPSPASATAG
jgi:signal transduction histidine kinase